jgi:transposase-like protein
VTDHVQPGSEVVTDGWKAYGTLATKGYTHHRVTQQQANELGEELLPHVHLVISLLKRWLRGTHQDAVTPAHLPAYLDEFAFRFNRRLSTHRGKLFYRLMQQAVSMRPPNVKELYGKHNI